LVKIFNKNTFTSILLKNTKERMFYLKKDKDDFEMIDKISKMEKAIRRNNIIILIIALLIIIFFAICIVGYKIGKIGYTSAPVAGEVDKEKIDIITVVDKEGTEFTLQGADLNIFNNTAFNGQKIIAPHSIGTYQFYVKNETKKDIKYNIRVMDEMNHFVNMKYKLKIDNIYMCGNKDNYVNIEELNVDDIILTKDSTTLYTLEWYWEDNDKLDTIVGTESNYKDEYYKLRLNIQAFDKINN